MQSKNPEASEALKKKSQPHIRIRKTGWEYRGALLGGGESDSECDEDIEVYIEKTGVKETFSLADSNDALKVKRRFTLDHEPACVFFGKKNKRVNFGSLEAHKTYKLEDGDKFPFQRLHSQNACILSNAVYKDNPMEYLSASSTTHTIHTVCAISENSDQEVIVAVGKIESSNQNVLYVAFRGTSTWKDVVADADIQLKSKDTIPGGKVHSGFDKRASVLPLKQMLHCAKKEDCAIIVTCGHSMGGAISAISAIDLMLHLDKDSDMAIHNITFGMPLFANKTVKQTCTANKFEQNMLHYIGHKDVVPGILSLGHTITQLKSRAKALMNEATGGVSEIILQRWSTYLEKAAKLGSYVLQLLPWETNDVKSDIQILCDLGSKILDDIKDTELGQRYSPDEFVPIGNYFVIEHDSLSLLESSKMTAQIQEVILKEPMRKVKDISDISKGHNLEDNYCANLIQILKLSSRSKRTLICNNLLQPKSRDETARLIFTKRQKGTVGCTLLVASSFLQNVQLHKINFEDLPFNASSTHNIQDFEDHEMLMISETSSNDVKRVLIDARLLSLKLMTPFGGISVKVDVKTAEHVPESDMMTETVSSIIEKSIFRCLMVSSLQEGSDHNADKDQLAMTVEQLIHMLSDEDVETYKTLKQGSTSQEESVQKIKLLSENIIQLCTEGIIYHESNNKGFFMDAIRVYMQFFQIALHWPDSAVRLVLEGKVENEYYAYLSYTCDQVLKFSASVAKGDTVLEDLQVKLNLEEQQDNKEIEEEETQMKKKQGFLTNIFIYSGLDTKTRTNILNRRKNKKIFLKESILSHLHTTNGGETSKLTEKIVSGRKLFVQQKVECFLAIHELRFVFSKQCFIGFVGPQNAGKSTLLNALFNKRVETGMTIHTDEATKYLVAENIFAVDFPGSDSLFAHKERFSQFGRINNFFVYVIPYNGTPSEELVQNVKMAYEMEMCTGKSAKTLFCINKAAREEVVFDKAYKTKFVRMIKDNIKENDFSQEESLMKKWSDGLKNRVAQTVANEAYDEIKAKYKELKEYTTQNLKEDDFIFTDWKHQDTNHGIEGPEDVRKRIKNYLVEAKVRSEDNLNDI